MSGTEKLKALVLDVDGVLTDGKIYIDATGKETKTFNTQDGFGIKEIMKLGVIIIIISGRSSKVVNIRMQELGIDHVHQGVKDKLPLFESIIEKLKLSTEQIAYVGDDIPDLQIMKRVKFPLTVANAVPEIKNIACHIATRNGGDGAVRELCDWLIKNHL